MNRDILVSVVMPVFNESQYIDKCVKSLLEQDYDIDSMEWIFVDGGSTDDTVKKLELYQEDKPDLITILNNPQKIVPYAMNIGIKNARGKYVVRMDAHADYAKDYISKCIKVLEETGADNVGGVAETKANGFVGENIALMLSSRFGVGNSEFRVDGKSGYVDTVPFGAFRREVFQKYGGYDVRLVRNQDNEMNYRIRKNGGQIYLSNDIHLSYYCRNTVRGICDMARKNGMWNIITMKLCPGSMGIRHFVPLAFVLSLVLLPVLSLIDNLFGLCFLFEICLYSLLDVWFSVHKSNSIGSFLLLLLLFPIFHISYGVGSIMGIVKLSNNEYRNSDYQPEKI